MSAASRSGSGEETTSANVTRNPPPSVSGSCMVRPSGTNRVGRRIATGSQDRRSPRGLASDVDNATQGNLFGPVANFFTGWSREVLPAGGLAEGPEPGTPRPLLAEVPAPPPAAEQPRPIVQRQQHPAQGRRQEEIGPPHFGGPVISIPKVRNPASAGLGSPYKYPVRNQGLRPDGLRGWGLGAHHPGLAHPTFRCQCGSGGNFAFEGSAISHNDVDGCRHVGKGAHRRPFRAGRPQWPPPDRRNPLLRVWTASPTGGSYHNWESG